MRLTKSVIKQFQKDAKHLSKKSELGQAFGFKKLATRLIRDYALTKEEACDILEFKNEEEILERLEKRYIKRRIKQLKMRRLYVFEVQGKNISKSTHLIARRGDAMEFEDILLDWLGGIGLVDGNVGHWNLKVYPILTDFYTFIKLKVKERGDVWEDQDILPVTLEELEGKQEKFNTAFKNASIHLTGHPESEG